MHQPSRRLLARTATLCACLAWPALALATPPTNVLGDFAYVCGGVASGAGLPISNIDLGDLFKPGESVCKEKFDPLMGSVKAKISHSGPRGTGGGTAEAQPGGRLRVRASNDAVGDGSEVGGALAGFTDVLTIQAPGLDGQPGKFYYKVRVKGTLETHGPSGGATLRVMPLSPRVTFAWRDWSVASDITTPDAFLAVDDTAVLAVGFVFSEPFSLTTVAWAQAGIRAQGGTGHGNLALDGRKAFRLQGVDHVTTYDDAPVTGFTVTSQAALPW